MNLMNGQTPMQEVQGRLAEAAPLYGAARAVAVEDFRASQHDHRRRVKEAEAAGWMALGMTDLAQKALAAVDEEMGDLSIRGDTVTNQYFQLPPAPEQKPAEAVLPPTTAPTPPASSGWLKPLLLGALLTGGAGAGGYALYNYLQQPDTNVAQPTTGTDQDWKFGIQVRDRE